MTLRKYLKKVLYKRRALKVLPILRKKLSLYANIGTLTKFKDKRILLPLIETSHYKSIQLLLIAKALQIRGAEVYVLVCDQALSACEIRSTQRDSHRACWKCKFNRNHILPIFDLKVISLSKYVDSISDSEAIGLMEEVKKQFLSFDTCVEDSVIRHYYGNVPSDSIAVSSIRNRHRITALRSWMAAEQISKEYGINLVLGYMVAYSEFVPYYEYFKSQNIPFKIISSTQFDGNAQIFNWPELYTSRNRFDRFVSSIGRNYLIKSEQDILYKYLNQRKSNKDPVLNDLGISKTSNDNITEFGIKINKEKRNVFLFSNVYWDVGLSTLTTIFPSVQEWVFRSIEAVIEQNNTHLYVRCHPAEALSYTNGQKGIQELIQEKFPILPCNVTIISSENPISSYALFPHIDLGLVYNGTIGLELLMDNIPVVMAGMAPYSFLKSVCNPNSAAEYQEVLKNTSFNQVIDKGEVEIFAYFYMIKTSIPWNLTEKAYGANILSQFEFASGTELSPQGDKFIDHLCNCLVDERISPENWSH